MGLVRAAASGGCAAACAAPKGLRARLRLERLRWASPRATQILACAAAHPRCSVMRACRTPTQVLEWSRKLASELLLGAMKLPCAADQSTHPATASFALIRRRRAFRVITKTFPWRGSAWTCSTCSRLRRDEPISLRMPFHRYDGPFRWPSPPSLRVILHREGRLPFATAAGDLNYTGSTWTGTLVRPHTSVGQLHPRTTRFDISLNGCTSGAAAR